MPRGKKKSYQLVPNKKNSSKTSTSTGTYAKISSKNNVSPSSSCSSTGSSKGLIRKNDVPKQVNNSRKLKKNTLKHFVIFSNKKKDLLKVNNFHKESC